LLLFNDSDINLIYDMGRAVKSNPEANKLLSGCIYEQSGYAAVNVDSKFSHPEFLKAKIDARKPGIIIDLKTTRAKCKYDLQKSVEDYNYDLQASYYLEIANQIEQYHHTGIRYEEFWWIWVTKDEPKCLCYKASAEDLRIGRIKFQNAYKILLNYYRTGFVNDELECPTWKCNKYNLY